MAVVADRAVAAIVVSYTWLTSGPEKLLDFRLLRMPIYAPLAFGIIWHLLVVFQALAARSYPQQAKLRRNWVALVVFVLSCLCSLPFVMAEIYAHDQQRAEKIQQEAWQNLVQSRRRAAEAAIQQRGILAFEESFQPEETGVLSYFISMHRLTPEQLQQSSERYTTPDIMHELAKQQDCPPEALEILITHATEQQQIHTDPLGTSQLLPVFESIASNPNTPAQLLVKMMKSQIPRAWMAAVKNPKLPVAVKMEYLKRGCELEGPFEPASVAENLDTPVDVLACLATKGGTQYALASNPHTPMEILEK